MADGGKTYDMRFAKGACHLVVGPVACGKTFRTVNIIKNKDQIIQDGQHIKNVVWCYKAWQPVYTKIDSQGLVTKWVNKTPTAEDFVKLVSEHSASGGSIVVIDDAMGDIGKDMEEIVTVLSRHNNTSTFLLFQNLFPTSKEARSISLNVKYIHIHKNPRENSQIATLARQLRPQGAKFIQQVYDEVTEKPYVSLLMDLTQEQDEKLRFRSHYLPSELPMRVYLPKGKYSV